jgi:hypothetical protein
MLRFAKKFCCLGLLALSVHHAHGFALVGPQEAWMTPVLGYDRALEVNYPSAPWTIYRNEAVFAPKNLNEWYRWSTPTLYYTYDPSFLTYFGSNGVAAVDAAFAILNGLDNVDKFSKDLSEFSTQEIRVNHSAASLHLFDLKSATLEMLVTRLGLADPERWIFTIKERILPPGLACPFYDLTVLQRNYDPLTTLPSKYVNGSLFTYLLDWSCPPAIERFDTLEFLLDPTETYQTAVASPKVITPNIRYYGHYHTHITRDDAGGLRYLYTTNRIALEQAPPDAIQFVTNNTPTLLVSSNLSILASQAYTNSAAVLAGLYPGIIILDSTNWFTNIYATNVTAYFTNEPWMPVGVPPLIRFSTNVTVSTIPVYEHTFGNLLTVKWTSDGYKMVPLYKLPKPSPAWVTIETTTIGTTNSPWMPSGSTLVVSNITLVTYLTNDVVGDYVLPPTNFCAAEILYAQLTNVITFTNPIVAATNTVIDTNTTGLTNAGTLLYYSQNLIQYFTNRVFVIHPVTCETNTVGLRQGLGKISFVRHDYDSLLNRYFFPITNNYKMVAVTNNTRVVQQFQRVVLRPDIVIASADLLNDIPNVPIVDHNGSGPVYNGTNGIPGLAGPGTLEGPIRLTYNQVGPVRLNSAPFFGDEVSSILFFNWASFDGSTNAPIVYGGTSIQDLVDQMTIMVTPGFLPSATEGASYNATLRVSGGQAPYIWAVSPASPNLPAGIEFVPSSTDTAEAALVGSPELAGKYNFQIRVTDVAGRFVDINYVLLVNVPSSF